MAFVDQVTIHTESGKGGNGVVRWAHTKMNSHAGPCGGDGGKGGDVLLVGVRDLSALSYYRHTKKFIAIAGGAGKENLKTGAGGADVILKVPVGTLARVVDTDEEYEITKESESITLFRGGFGGKGNAHFKSSTNQNPFEKTNGKDGKGGDVEFTLKIIADAGLVGLPNAGKSSLLNALTRAKSKIGSYPFTTLEPNLGDFYGYILADVPGLIEGAASGRGLGIKFLKHVERTGILLHLVSSEQDDPLATYNEIHTELEAFGHGLINKKEIVVLSKVDVISTEERAEKIKLLEETGKEVLCVSVEDSDLLKQFSDRLTAILR